MTFSEEFPELKDKVFKIRNGLEVIPARQVRKHCYSRTLVNDILRNYEAKNDIL